VLPKHADGKVETKHLFSCIVMLQRYSQEEQLW